MHVVDFFFQAEDGIRDWSVTGVQTCALPISDATYIEPLDVDILTKIIERERPDAVLPTLGGRSEERRVGKDRRSASAVSGITKEMSGSAGSMASGRPKTPGRTSASALQADGA